MITVTVKDYSEVVTKKLRAELTSRVKKTTRRLKQQIENTLLHKDRTGNLRASWQELIEEDLNNIVGQVYSEVFYAKYVEGHTGFVTDAIEKVQNELEILITT